MTKAPGEPLQKAVFSALLASADVVTAFGAAPPRVYDEVPDQRFPYIVIGDDQILDDGHCEAAFEAICTIHVFSRKPGEGKTEAKDIGDAVVSALNVQLSIGGFVCVHDDADPPFQSAQYFYEPDGKTAHGVLVFRYLIDQAVS